MGFARIRPKRGTANQWTSANTILAEGEIGFEVPDAGIGTGLCKVKMGDGATPWNSLPYAGIVYNAATTSANGLMSSTDKSKLNGIAANANNYTLPSATNDVRGGVRLSDSTSGSGTAADGWAASPVAVKAAYDLASGKQNAIIRGMVAGTSSNDGKNVTYSAAVPLSGVVNVLIVNMGIYMLYRYANGTTSGWVATVVDDPNVVVGMGTANFSITNKKSTAAYFILL